MLVDKPLSLFAKAIFAFVAINALAGAVSLIFFPSLSKTLFFWEVKPPLNAALFGALYLGGAFVVGWLTYLGRWENARFLVPILVSAGALISLTTLLHFDRFTAGFRFLYWLVVYMGAPLLALWIYFSHERPGANWTVSERVKPVTRSLAIALGSVLLILGILILAFPHLVVSQWPWPTSPLMTRIFTSWFSAFGVGLLWFVFERDWRRLHLIPTLMVAAAGLDLFMIFLYRNTLTASINLWVYCAHLALFGVVGLLMHYLQRKT